MTGPSAGDDANVAEFTHQAESFEASAVVRLPQTLDAVVALVPADPAARWLEAACGGGVIARALAARVGSVQGVDLTPAMLEVARREAAARGLGNVTFSLGDATALQLPDAGLDGAITRFSLHHVPVPGRLVAEMARVVRPGGLVIVADHVADEDPDGEAWHQQIERVRDPSHWACLTPARLRALGAAAGLELEHEQLDSYETDFCDWVARGSGAGATELIEAALREPPGRSERFAITERDGGRMLRLTQWLGRWRRPD
jgi:SAM-dependent methyltransferase